MIKVELGIGTNINKGIIPRIGVYSKLFHIEH
jgi:hypothetical protein